MNRQSLLKQHELRPEQGVHRQNQQQSEQIQPQRTQAGRRLRPPEQHPHKHVQPQQSQQSAGEEAAFPILPPGAGVGVFPGERVIPQAPEDGVIQSRQKWASHRPAQNGTGEKHQHTGHSDGVKHAGAQGQKPKQGQQVHLPPRSKTDGQELLIAAENCLPQPLSATGW